MGLGRLVRGRRVLAGFWGATVVQVAAVAADAGILKQGSKVMLMPLLWQWSRTQDAPPLKDPAQRSWRVLGAYAVLWAALIAVLSPGLGKQRVPVAVYALLLTATAVASRWHNTRSGVGGALFLVSDALIALRMAGRDFPGRGALTMSTYAIGQYLLTDGVTRTAGRSDR